MIQLSWGIKTMQMQDGDRHLVQNKPEYRCPKCGASPGQWCYDLVGDDGWQHADRPRSSWEPDE